MPQPTSRRRGRGISVSWLNSSDSEIENGCDLDRTALHLDLQADAELFGVGTDGVETRVLVEDHHAGVELLDDVVQVDLAGLLIEVEIERCDSFSKAGLGELAEHLELAGADNGRKEIAPEHVATVIGAVSTAVTTEPVVLRPLRFDRIRPTARDLTLEEKVRAVRVLVAALRLRSRADRQQVLVAVVSAVQVIAGFLVPEIDLDAACADDRVVTGRGRTVERPGRYFHHAELAPIRRAVVSALKDERIPVLHAVGVHGPVMRV